MSMSVPNFEFILPPYEEEVQIETPGDAENTQAFYRKVCCMVDSAIREGNEFVVQRIRFVLRQIQRKAEDLGFDDDMYYSAEYKNYLDRYEDYFEMVGDEDIIPLSVFLEDCIEYTRGSTVVARPYPIVPDYQWHAMMRGVENDPTRLN